MLGGTVDARSEPGQGTQFDITLATRMAAPGG
jgi:signal transduction histidine kinase